MHPQLRPLEHREPEGPGRLRPVAPGLWATPDEPLGDGPAVTCGFLLQRPAGNAFVYSCSAIGAYYDHLDQLGGVALVLLNHRDEATRHVTTLAEHYAVPVRTHLLEVDACTRRGVHPITPLTEPQTALGPDLVALHTPGHTPGTVSYLWTNQADGRRYAFTGDTFSNFTLDRFPAVLGFHDYPGNLDDLRGSLDRLEQEPSDVLVPGLANGTVNAYDWSGAARPTVLDHARQQLPGAEPRHPTPPDHLTSGGGEATHGARRRR